MSERRPAPPGTRLLPRLSPRPETGPIRFGDDWTGIFFRGDTAFFFAMSLRDLLTSDTPGALQRRAAWALVRLLATACESEETRERLLMEAETVLAEPYQ